MSIVYHGAPLQYSHDPIPLDNPKNHTALLYVTWGLIQDPKIKKEIPIEFFSQDKIEVSLENKRLEKY